MAKPFRSFDELCRFVEKNRWVLLVNQVREATGEQGLVKATDWTLVTSERPHDRRLFCYTLAGDGGTEARVGEHLPPIGRGIAITKSLRDTFNRKLAAEDERASRVTNRPLDYAVVAVDIARFSEMQPVEQLLAANALAWALERLVSRDDLYPVGRICTGDGYTLIFESPTEACRFSALVAATLERLNDRVSEVARMPMQLHFRIGIHHGPVHRFRDWTDANEWNYIGSAVNDAHRVLTAIGSDLDDVVFVSDEVRRQLPETMRVFLGPQGRRSDKHGKWHRVFLLAHDSWLHDNRNVADRDHLNEALLKETGITFDLSEQ